MPDSGSPLPTHSITSSDRRCCCTQASPSPCSFAFAQCPQTGRTPRKRCLRYHHDCAGSLDPPPRVPLPSLSSKFICFRLQHMTKQWHIEAEDPSRDLTMHLGFSGLARGCHADPPAWSGRYGMGSERPGIFMLVDLNGAGILMLAQV